MKVACDFVLLNLAARCEQGERDVLWLQLPSIHRFQQPMVCMPNLALSIWRHWKHRSEIWADDPAVTHTSLRVIGFSSDVTVRSKAAGFLDPSSELEHLLVVCAVRHAPNHFLLPFDRNTSLPARLKQGILCLLWCDITSPLYLQVRAW